MFRFLPTVEAFRILIAQEARIRVGAARCHEAIPGDRIKQGRAFEIIECVRFVIKTRFLLYLIAEVGGPPHLSVADGQDGIAIGRTSMDENAPDVPF